MYVCVALTNPVESFSKIFQVLSGNLSYPVVHVGHYLFLKTDAYTNQHFTLLNNDARIDDTTTTQRAKDALKIILQTTVSERLEQKIRAEGIQEHNLL